MRTGPSGPSTSLVCESLALRDSRRMAVGSATSYLDFPMSTFVDGMSPACRAVSSPAIAGFFRPGLDDVSVARPSPRRPLSFSLSHFISVNQ